MNDSTPRQTVGEVARMMGISVRTLHHYDALALVTPSGRSTAGYRTYAPADVERLYAVLTYRELGFALEEIKTILDDPDANPMVHLQRQRRLLQERIDHLSAMALAVDTVMKEKSMGINLSAEEQREIWGENWLGDEYNAEAKDRWGDTDAWKQSAQVTAGWTKDDWRKVKADGDALEADLAAAMASGVAPGSPEADALAERHREGIARFYDCDHRMQVNVASMYTADPRFEKHYEDIAEGLAAWLVEVIEANARKHGA